MAGLKGDAYHLYFKYQVRDKSSSKGTFPSCLNIEEA